MTMKKIEAASPEAQSANLVADNVAQLKALFPELVTEGPHGPAVNLDVLKALVGDATVTDAEEKYGLNWHGKRAARQLALTPSTGTLRPCPDESVDWDTTKNLMIEGDNLEVLKLLQKSYAGKVKLIYIDPPYNTGKDFVYPDDFKDSIRNYLGLTGQVEGGRKISSNTEASGRFHTDWLNMMYPRLKVARDLLSEDGVIFISIDDGEFANARSICDEVFGQENFIAAVVRNTNSSKNQSLQFSISHDYAIAYARDNDHLTDLLRKTEPWGVPKNNLDAYLKSIDQLLKMGVNGEDLTNELKELTSRPRFIDFVNYWHTDRYFEQRGVYRKGDLGGVTDGNMTPLENPLTGKLDPVPPGGFRFPPARLKELQEDGRIHFHTDGSLPTIKRYLRENLVSRPKGIMSDDQRPDYSRLKSFGIDFDNPKQLAFMERILSLAGSDALVLDFFAGSGTTGDAVMCLNARDRGNRRYILIQLPEPTSGSNRFCSLADITKERLRKAGELLLAEKPKSLFDCGFRVFKLDSSNIRAWEPDRDDLDQTLLDHAEHLEADRTEQDVLYELLLKLGLDLCVPIESKTIASKAVHSIGGGVLLACLATQITRDEVEPLAQGIVAWHQALAPAGDTTCVFRDSAFADDVAKTNMAAILQQHGIANVRSL